MDNFESLLLEIMQFICTACDFGLRMKSEHFHDLNAPTLSVRSADFYSTRIT